jgi:hypothetical protein
MLITGDDSDFLFVDMARLRNGPHIVLHSCQAATKFHYLPPSLFSAISSKQRFSFIGSWCDTSFRTNGVACYRLFWLQRSGGLFWWHSDHASSYAI